MCSPRQDRDRCQRLTAFASLPASARYRNRGTNGRVCVQYRRTLTDKSAINSCIYLQLNKWVVSELALRSGADSRENRQEYAETGCSTVIDLTAELQNWAITEGRLQDRRGAGFLWQCPWPRAYSRRLVPHGRDSCRRSPSSPAARRAPG